MIIFWILAAGLAGLALLFIVPPLLTRRPVSAGIARDDLNLALFRQQLAELDSDLAAGNLDQAQYDSARRDLERELLSDVDAATTANPGDRQGGRWVAALLAIAVPAGALGLYLHLGQADIIPRLETAAQAQTGTVPGHGDAANQLPAMEVLVQRLAARMEKNPGDLEGWMMLGRSYYAVDKPKEALAAFQRAYELAPDDAEVLSAYAQGLATANDGNLDGRPAELIRKALDLDPNNTSARWMEGMLAFQNKRFGSAVTAWETVLPRLNPTSDEAAELRQFIDAARRRAGQTAATPSADTAAEPAQAPAAPTEGTPATARPADATQSTSGAAATSNPAGVTVSVSLDESLWYRAAAEDTLFVYAKAVDGPPMPLAVKRAQVRDLPLTVTLDDSLAMTPELRLSGFSQVIIGARISKSGVATPQSGDLEGETGPLTPGETGTVPLAIDRARP